MSAKNPHGFYVGQSLYSSPSTFNKFGGEKVIEKIGNKWAVLNDGNRFDIQTLEVDGKGFTAPYSIWKNKEAFEQKKELDAAWSSLQRKISYTYSVPKHLTLENVKQIISILEVQP